MCARWSLLLRQPGMLVIILAVLLGACASTGSGKFTFYVPDYSGLKDVPPRSISAADGTSLAYRQLGDISSDNVLIIVPGSTMYGYYYLGLMKDISDAGTYTRVIDLRGHGDSGGPRGDVPCEDSLVDDLCAHIDHIRSSNPHARVYIAGHSMGAGICGRYLEKYGYDSVAGAIYIAPFFHYRQPGMKDAGYVDVDIVKTIFGTDHVFTQVYHPTGNDPKLVRNYTKIMSRASMLSSYSSFRRDHTTRALYLIGTRDELFDWQASPKIFSGCGSVEIVTIDGATHLGILEKSAGAIRVWMDGASTGE